MPKVNASMKARRPSVDPTIESMGASRSCADFRARNPPMRYPASTESTIIAAVSRNTNQIGNESSIPALIIDVVPETHSRWQGGAVPQLLRKTTGGGEGKGIHGIPYFEENWRSRKCTIPALEIPKFRNRKLDRHPARGSARCNLRFRNFGISNVGIVHFRDLQYGLRSKAVNSSAQ